MYDLVTSYSEWSAFFMTVGFILKPRSDFKFDKNKHFRRRTALLSKKSIFTNYMYFHLSVSC